jgi:hypothetical protein
MIYEVQGICAQVRVAMARRTAAGNSATAINKTCIVLLDPTVDKLEEILFNMHGKRLQILHRFI